MHVLLLVTPTPTPVPTPTPTPTASVVPSPVTVENPDLVKVLGDLVALLDERLGTNPVNDVFAPIATVILAVAAVVVAVLSWRTARRANVIVERHRDEDQTAKEARFRRGIAVDVKDWLDAAAWRAKFGVYFETNDDDGKRLWEQRKRIVGRLEREGEENGLRLMNLLQRKLTSLNVASEGMIAKQIAQARHPSRVNAERDELVPLVKRWADNPADIEPDLNADESGEALKSRARAEALLRMIKKMDADASGKSKKDGPAKDG